MRSSGRVQVSRRTVLVGALSISVLSAGPVAAEVPCELEALGRQFERLTRRCSRLYGRMKQCSEAVATTCHERDVQAFLPDGRRNSQRDDVERELGYDAVWKEWSETVAGGLDLAETIRRTPAVSVTDLAVKYRALLWELYHDSMAETADPEHVRLLKGFGRELDRLAGGEG